MTLTARLLAPCVGVLAMMTVGCQVSPDVLESYGSGAVPAASADNTTVDSAPGDSALSNSAPLDSAPLVSASMRYGKRDHQTLLVFAPTQPGPGDGRAIVYFHAGGWVDGSAKDVSALFVHQLARGYTVVSVNYGLAPEFRFPMPIVEAKAAVRFVQQHAEALGIDPTNLTVAGSSAGGHIAAMVAFTPGEFEPSSGTTQVQSLVTLAGIFDIELLARSTSPWGQLLAAQFMGCKVHECAASDVRSASPNTFDGITSPAVYLGQGMADDLVVPEQAQSLHRRLPTAPDVVLDLVDCGNTPQHCGHTIDLGVDLDQFHRWLDAQTAS
jgi:acetyl esterase